MNGCLIDPLNLIIKMQAGNDVNALIELREILELNTIRMAAQRATEEDVIELRRAEWLINEPGIDRAERQNRDIAFHNTIAKIAGNLVIEELLNSLRAVIAQNVESFESEEFRFRFSRDFHCEMVDAISEQNPDQAATVMRDYFDAVYQSIGI